MVVFPCSFWYVSRIVRARHFRRRCRYLRFRGGAIEMTLDAEVNGEAYGYDCCGAQ